jgi:AAA domain/Homeodomain-like domain
MIGNRALIFANAINFAALMEPVARQLLGEPNPKLSKPPRDVRFGTHGSMAVDFETGQFFDHEAKVGGGTIGLIAHKTGRDHGEAMAWLRREGYLNGAPHRSTLHQSSGDGARVESQAEQRSRPRFVSTYDYTDESGTLLHQVVRYAEPKRFNQRRPGAEHGTWEWNLDGVRRVLYRLPDLLVAVADGSTIYVTEGEKDCDNVRGLGFTATTCPGGAGKWLAQYNESLRNSDVVIIGDNDDAGRDHAEQVAASLNGVAKRLRVLDLAKVWAACPDKGDISDWIAAAGSADKLAAMVEALPEWQPSADGDGKPNAVPLTAAEFLRLDLPLRQRIIAPWLPEKGLAMIYSPRGVGKTLLGLTSAYAIAAGAGFLEFKIEAPRKVLYLDGEMPAQTMQERLAAIIGGFSKQPPTTEHFRILLSDLTEFGLPDLATPEGQAWIDARVGDAEVIILDNVSTLVRTGKENEAEGWLPVQSWALRHRRAGRAVILLHHAGKGGAQRGTSRREDVLDTVISLRRPADYSPDQGARFELHYEKCRGFYGNDAQPFEARYEVRDGAAVWTRTEIVDAERARVVTALKDGMSIREAADALGIHRSKVERLRRKAMEAGELSTAATSDAAE